MEDTGHAEDPFEEKPKLFDVRSDSGQSSLPMDVLNEILHSLPDRVLAVLLNNPTDDLPIDNPGASDAPGGDSHAGDLRDETPNLGGVSQIDGQEDTLQENRPASPDTHDGTEPAGDTDDNMPGLLDVSDENGPAAKPHDDKSTTAEATKSTGCTEKADEGPSITPDTAEDRGHEDVEETSHEGPSMPSDIETLSEMCRS